MGFTWAHLQRHPWSSFGLTEDVERHLALVLAGERVVLASETAVHSAMPESLDGATSQQSRWEAGKLTLVRRWTPRLLAAGARERDPVRVHAGLELVVPPQSLLALSAAAGVALGTLARLRGPRRLALACGAAQAAFVAGGMLRMRAPAAAWRGLALAPALALRKAAVVGRIAAGRGPSGWERTARDREARRFDAAAPGHAPGMPGSLPAAALDRLRDVPRAAQRALRARRPVTAAELTWRWKRRQGDPDIRVVDDLVRPGQQVLDIGANWGLFTARLGKLVGPTGHVEAFEPLPVHAATLHAVAAQLPAVDVHMTALSDHEGQAELVIPAPRGRAADGARAPRRARARRAGRTARAGAAADARRRPRRRPRAGRPRQVRRRGPRARGPARRRADAPPRAAGARPRDRGAPPARTAGSRRSSTTCGASATRAARPATTGSCRSTAFDVERDQLAHLQAGEPIAHDMPRDYVNTFLFVAAG